MKLTSVQRSFEGLLVLLAVGYLGERLALLPAPTESMRRVSKWENGQHVEIIWDAQDRLDLGRPEEPDPVRADSF